MLTARSLITRALRSFSGSGRSGEEPLFEQLENRQLMTIVVANPISDTSITRGSIPTVISLLNRYTDADVTAMVRMSVGWGNNTGNIDIALLAGLAPNTVTNFLQYVNEGFYTNTLFHRSVNTSANGGYSILQGGSYSRPTAVLTGPELPVGPTTDPTVKTPTHSAIALENPNGNLAYTIAMARGQAANSATSGFFFNTADNSDVFDQNQGGNGYAVFGTVLPGTSRTVLNTLQALATRDVSTGNSAPFPNSGLTQIPLSTGTYPISPTDYAWVSTATVLSGIYGSFEVISSNNDIATGTVNGSNLVITPTGTATGTATITVRVTGYDGTIITDSFEYTVNNAAPATGGMQGQSNVAVGESMLLSTYGVRDPDTTSPIASVSFYSDTNENGELDEEDELLGTDTSATGGWNARVDTTGLSAGANRFFARTTDVDGGTTTVTRVITLRPEVPGGEITPNPGNAIPGNGVPIEVGELPDASGIRRVSIFLDVDNDGQLNPLTDRLLGHATYSEANENWAFTVSGGDLSMGSNRIFARTADNYGNLGGVTSAIINVAIP